MCIPFILACPFEVLGAKIVTDQIRHDTPWRWRYFCMSLVKIMCCQFIKTRQAGNASANQRFNNLICMLCIDFNINACVLYTHKTHSDMLSLIKHLWFIYNYTLYKIISTLTKKSLYHQVKYMGNYTSLFYCIVGFLNLNSFEAQFPNHWFSLLE